MSLRNLIFKKSFFGMDFIFKEIPDRHVKFDYETFHSAECEFLVGVTDCKTGKPLYFNKNDIRKYGFDILRASSSLPLLSPIVNLKDYELLDGGISNSIPIDRSIKDGNDKNIIILTRNKGYRKSPLKFTNLIKMKYKKYPLLIEAMMNRYKKYNDTLDYIEDLENSGKAIIIRASKEIKVDRLEKDPEKLRKLFKNGYEDAENIYNRIKSFIK